MISSESHTQCVTTLRTGVDLTKISSVADSVRTFGTAFLNRIFTEGETEYCEQGTSTAETAQRLAARFAAKEAVVKVLRPLEFRPEWTSIEIVRHPSGWCEVVLTGTAAAMAAEAGITEIQISMSHEGDTAIATAVAFVASTKQG